MKLAPFLVVLVVVLGCGNLEQPKTTTTQTNQPAQTTSNNQPPPIAVKSTALVREYKENEIAADEKYKNKRLEVSGKITDIAETFGNLTVSLQGNDFTSLMCSFDESQKPEIAKLKNGQTVTLQGTNDGMTGGLYVGLSDCQIKK